MLHSVVNAASSMFHFTSSGLDSFTSLAIMEMLSHLAKKFHKTIVVTLHQPRADIFALFDNLLLLR